VRVCVHICVCLCSYVSCVRSLGRVCVFCVYLCCLCVSVYLCVPVSCVLVCLCLCSVYVVCGLYLCLGVCVVSAGFFCFFVAVRAAPSTPSLDHNYTTGQPHKHSTSCTNTHSRISPHSTLNTLNTLNTLSSLNTLNTQHSGH